MTEDYDHAKEIARIRKDTQEWIVWAELDRLEEENDRLRAELEIWRSTYPEYAKAILAKTAKEET